MLVDKNACNKPLTLDCQVNANPSANVTWYRRRPNKRSAVRTSKYFSIFNFDPSKLSINLSDNDDQQQSSDAYEDEWIGEGPTYTIASLNCANLVSNVRNMTNQRHLSPTKSTVTRSTQVVKHLKNGRQQRETSASDPSGRKLRQDDPESGVLDYEDDVEFDELSGHQSFEFEADKQANENNDFGVYICVAKNRAVDAASYQSPSDQTQASKRFIKLNPVGAPIVRALSSSQAQLDEAETRTAAETDARIEMTAKIGSSATLTCIIEPVPEFSSVYWVKDGGKIIPNSRYSTSDDFGEKNAIYSISSSEESKHRFLSNFKVRYENVTSTSDKANRPASSSSSIDGIAAYDSVGVLRSVLYIRNVRKQDLGVYKCKAINSYGSRVASILLREKTLLGKLKMILNFLKKVFKINLWSSFDPSRFHQQQQLVPVHCHRRGGIARLHRHCPATRMRLVQACPAHVVLLLSVLHGIRES